MRICFSDMFGVGRVVDLVRGEDINIIYVESTV